MISTLAPGSLALLTASLAGWLLLVNGMTLMAFYVDKRRSMAGEWRVPEKTLLMLAMIGGWPSAKASQMWFRHKTQKPPFRILLNLSVLPMLGLVGFLAAPQVDWAGLSEQATGKAMDMLGQTSADSAPAKPTKPGLLVMGKTTPTKVSTDASASALPTRIGPSAIKSGAWHSR